jgi:hypothetical protein
VELVSDRRFRFDVAPDAFWSAISATAEYRVWWPWLRAFSGEGLLSGDEWHCAVRPQLPYTLRFVVHLGTVEPPTLIDARVDGDIAGAARLRVAPHERGCVVRLTSRLAPTERGLSLLAAITRPLVRLGHDWILDTGARQFAISALGA